ncbi:MAG: hypothetical protein KatS3mg054_1021 [Chloroflexus sp.]|nr:MAG: hypothetical protein KatS3mg054_1021 [Chloroflexus sp.]
MSTPAADHCCTLVRDNGSTLSPAARLYQHFLPQTRNHERESWLRYVLQIRRSPVASTISQIAFRSIRTMKQFQY